jgi:hypothetical protein
MARQCALAAAQRLAAALQPARIALVAIFSMSCTRQ